MTKISNADARADFRRSYRWQSTASAFLTVGLFVLAMRQLGGVEGDAITKVVWLLLPLPALAWAVREQVTHHRRMDEFQRTLNARATEISFPLTVAWLVVVALLATAFGFPIQIPGPFGLPPDELDWGAVIMVALLLHMVAFMAVNKRYFSKK